MNTPQINVSTPEPQGTPPPEPANLTDLGRRTLSGYRLKWGPLDGLEKFNDALAAGRITRDKMIGKPARKAKK